MRRWIRRTVVAVLAWGALIGYAELTDRTPHLIPLAGGLFATLAVCWLCLDGFELAEPPHWWLYRSTSSGRTLDPRFSRLSQALAETDDAARVSAFLHDSLVETADTRLRDVRGVDRAEQPEAARALLGNRVADYLNGPPPLDRNPFSPTVDAVLDTLEAL